MRTQLTINDQLLSFERNWFTGTLKYSKDGKTMVLQSAFDPRTHVWFTLTRKYKIELNSDLLEIEHRRPLMFSFSKPHTYTFRLNGEIVKTIEQ